MTKEFDLIHQYFQHRQTMRADVVVSVGDDCALLSVPEGYQLAVSTDTAVCGTHFLVSANGADVAHKVLMSNLSDLAAMGATPAWVSMALTMPRVDHTWLSDFSDTFFQLADAHQLQLIGGDTTQGPLSISLTIHGFIPQGEALTRAGAKEGDWVFVSGDLGNSKAGLEVILATAKQDLPHAVVDLAQSELETRHWLTQQHYRPQSRIALGEALRGVATSCIDISDGLLADLSHVLKASNVGAQLWLESIPVSQNLINFYHGKEKAQTQALTSGEEYELCFTVPQDKRQWAEEHLSLLAPCTCIGQIQASYSHKVELLNHGKPMDFDEALGFEHFN